MTPQEWKDYRDGTAMFHALETELTPWQYEQVRPSIDSILFLLFRRSIYRARNLLEGVRSPESTNFRVWAGRWLAGWDRTHQSACAASKLAVSIWSSRVAEALGSCCATEASELLVSSIFGSPNSIALENERQKQARLIRKIIPNWPGDTP